MQDFAVIALYANSFKNNSMKDNIQLLSYLPFLQHM